jgi:hypothetical protein
MFSHQMAGASTVFSCAKALKHAYAREAGGTALALNHACAREELISWAALFRTQNAALRYSTLQVNMQISFTLY